MFYSVLFFISRKHGIFGTLLCLLLVITTLPLSATVGDLDSTFGGDGKVITHLGFSSGSITDMALQADGKFVAVGDFGVARLLTTGELDPAFAKEGITFPAGINFHAVVIQPDSKLVVGGGNYAFTVARYNADGSLDSSFDGDGIVVTKFERFGSSTALVFQPDGKLVAAGSVLRGYIDMTVDCVLVRYNADGSLDSSFGNDGKIFTDLGDTEFVTALIIQPDGKLVALTGGSNGYTLLRYNPDGSFDSSFDNDGKIPIDFHANDLALQPDTKLVVVGYGYSGDTSSFLLVRYNADGSLDTSFGGTGRVITDLGDADQADTLAPQPDGKLIAAGSVSINSNTDFALVRYNPDGSLDSSFDDDGKILTDFGGNDFAVALAPQSDGKLVAGGVGNNPFFVRYNIDGSLDSTFNGNGKYDLQLGSSKIEDMVVQPDGKLVAAGEANTNPDFALVRYNTNGSPDTDFGSNGKVLTDFGSDSHAYTLVLQPDGKLIAAGAAASGSGSDFALVRYNTDGSLDNSFAGTGSVCTDFGGDDWAKALTLQPDGKLVLAGYSATSYGSDFALARYNADGSLDTSFARAGKALTTFGSYGRANDIVLQPDGRIVTAGEANTDAGFDFALARYNGDGSLDTSFDGDGKVLTDFGGNDFAVALVLQPDGKLVAAGYTGYNVSSGITLARYNADGSLDSAFDSDGKVLDFCCHNVYVYDLALQPDGKLITAGMATTAAHSNDFVLVRYTADGSLDSSFDNDGKIFTNFGGNVFALVLQPDGKFVAGGQVANTFGLARYLSDNTAPIAVNDLYRLDMNTVLKVSTPGVLSNDSDPDGDPLIVVQEGGSSNSRLTLSIDGSFIYTSNLGFSGSDIFSYRASDGQSASNLATITITVPTASERIDLLTISIQQLVTSNLLNRTQGDILLTQLTNARQYLVQNDSSQAINVLYAVINQVADFITASVLTPEMGQPLIDALNVTITQLQTHSTIYLPYVSHYPLSTR